MKSMYISDMCFPHKSVRTIGLRNRFLFLIVFFSSFQLSFSIEKVNDVYLITIPEDLDTFAALVNDGDSAIRGVLVNDIWYINRSSNIGNYYSRKPFCGTLDGAGHTLTFAISLMGHEISLCQYLTHGGTIKNLHLKGSIKTCGYSSASLVGHMEDGLISNCLVEVDIISDSNQELGYGGLVGTTHGKSIIENCVYQGVISGSRGYTVGGLVGKVCAPGTIIRNCVSICDFQVRPSDTNSNAVLNTDSIQWVTLHNVYYSGKCSWEHTGLQKIPNNKNLNEYIYKIWGNQVVQHEKMLIKKDEKHENDLRMNEEKIRMVEYQAMENLSKTKEKEGRLVIYIVLLSILITFLLVAFIIYYQQNKLHILEIKSLQNNIYQQNQIWKSQVDELKRALEPEPTPEEEQAKNANEALYKKLLQIMEEKALYKNPDLDETMLARTLCTNNNRISKCINEISGKSLKDWLAIYRVAHAKELITEMEKEGHVDICKVIEQSGYSSRSTFYRQFKKVTGTSPFQIKSQNSSENGE